MSKLSRASITVNLTNQVGKKTFSFVSSGFTQFFNAQHFLIQLSARERAYFDFLCEKMQAKNNYITIDSKLKGAFITHLSAITNNKHNPSLKSVTRYNSVLIGLNLLISMGGKLSDFYCINPKYAFKGTSIQRKSSLKQLIEQRDQQNLPIDMLINEFPLRPR